MAFCPICTQPMNEFLQDGKTKRIFCSNKCRGVGYEQCQNMIDFVAVWRLVRGEIPTVTTRAERMQATANLTARGYSLIQIADIMRTTPRSISRYRRRLKCIPS